jgi:hypothetical protein
MVYEEWAYASTFSQSSLCAQVQNYEVFRLFHYGEIIAPIMVSNTQENLTPNLVKRTQIVVNQ